MDLANAKRCPAQFNGGDCGSLVFYDWGLQVFSEGDWNTIAGGVADRYKDFASPNNVKICARCTTPYIVEFGTFIDISDELTAEDVKAILSRGQATLPHVKIKDP